LSIHYVIRQAPQAPELTSDFESATWRSAEPLAIANFHPQSSRHRPVVRARLAYQPDALCAIFQVHDRYVRSVNLNYQDPVCRDSCVEMFVQPRADGGYFNFEINCGGTMLLYYIEDPGFAGDRFGKYTPVAREHARLVRIATTMPRTTPIEIQDPIEWRVELMIPFAVLEAYSGPIGNISGQRWRGNLYKCADDSSHPHWASWSPIGEQLNFHQPDRFGEWQFE
jgi:hypothetical protein